MDDRGQQSKAQQSDASHSNGASSSFREVWSSFRENSRDKDLSDSPIRSSSPRKIAPLINPPSGETSAQEGGGGRDDGTTLRQRRRHILPLSQLSTTGNPPQQMVDSPISSPKLPPCGSPRRSKRTIEPNGEGEGTPLFDGGAVSMKSNGGWSPAVALDTSGPLEALSPPPMANNARKSPRNLAQLRLSSDASGAKPPLSPTMDLDKTSNSYSSPQRFRGPQANGNGKSTSSSSGGRVHSLTQALAADEDRETAAATEGVSLEKTDESISEPSEKSKDQLKKSYLSVDGESDEEDTDFGVDSDTGMDSFYRVNSDLIRDLMNNMNGGDSTDINKDETSDSEAKGRPGILPPRPLYSGELIPTPGESTDTMLEKRLQSSLKWALKCEPVVHHVEKSPEKEPLMFWDPQLSDKLKRRDEERAAALAAGTATNQVVFDCYEDTPGDDRTQPILKPNDKPLIFESRFDSGNLLRATMTGQYEYDLIIRPDINTRRHTQWYYFYVRNMKKGVKYRFNFLNFEKRKSLYKIGMQPLVYSETRAKEEGIGWFRTGSDVCYYTNQIRHRRGRYQTMSFCVEFPYEDDTMYFCYSQPYSYNDLQRDLKKYEEAPGAASRLKRRKLCLTLAGNRCELLTISDFANTDNMAKRQGVVLSARVHSGETPASIMMKGVLDHLLGDSPEAKLLRSHFIFKVIPVLNPDGVKYGNYRCSLAGSDLNRRWKYADKTLHPTIYHTKHMIRLFQQDRKVVLYTDLHGHSRKNNVFMYGCNNKGNPSLRLLELIYPKLLSMNSPHFNFNDCHFKMQKSKESTARIVVRKEFNLVYAYTMEATFSGASIGPMARYHFNSKQFEEAGRSLVDTLLDFTSLRNREKVEGVLQSLREQFPVERDDEESPDSGGSATDDYSDEKPRNVRASKPKVKRKKKKSKIPNYMMQKPSASPKEETPPPPAPRKRPTTGGRTKPKLALQPCLARKVEDRERRLAQLRDATAAAAQKAAMSEGEERMSKSPPGDLNIPRGSVFRTAKPSKRIGSAPVGGQRRLLSSQSQTVLSASSTPLSQMKADYGFDSDSGIRDSRYRARRRSDLYQPSNSPMMGNTPSHMGNAARALRGHRWMLTGRLYGPGPTPYEFQPHFQGGSHRGNHRMGVHSDSESMSMGGAGSPFKVRPGAAVVIPNPRR